MTVRLRAHHLLCMLTYVGKGYTPGFTVNYDRVAERLSRGEEIEIVEGPDDICAPLLSDPAAHCNGESVKWRDDTALASIAALLESKVGPGSRITLNSTLLSTLRVAFANGGIRAACKTCEWSSLCDTVSKSGFCGVKINAAASQLTSSP